MRSGPGVVAANSCNYLVWEDDDEAKGLLFLGGLLNSTLLEWRFRLTSSNNHVNNYEIDDLPVPQANVKEIIQAADRLFRYYSVAPFGASAYADAHLENALDAAVFLAFGLDRNDVSRVMADTAPGRVGAVTKLMAT